MYYKDLTFYRDEETGTKGVFNIYPGVFNIGWLDREHPYTKGDVSKHLIEKLKNLTFLKIKHSEDRKNCCFDKNKATIVHLMQIRGTPEKCFLCEQGGKEVFIEPLGLTLYSGKRNMLLGTGEMGIPALENGRFYAFPTMLYHYIVEHQYRPPTAFLNALEKFDITAPYDIGKEQSDLECLQISASKLYDLDKKS